MECGFVVLINISSAFVIGPILGGALYGNVEIERCCLIMSGFATVSAMAFILLGICLNDGEKNEINLNGKKMKRRGAMNYLPKSSPATDNECNPCCWPNIPRDSQNSEAIESYIDSFEAIADGA
jgi:hypothetical protein